MASRRIFNTGRVSAFVAILMVMGLTFTSLPFSQVRAQSVSDTLASVVPATSVMYMDVQLDQESNQVQLAYDLLDRSGVSALMQSESNASPQDAGSVAADYDLTGSAAIVFTDAEALVASSTSPQALTGDAVSATMDSTAVAMPMQQVPSGFAIVFAPDDADALEQQLMQLVTGEAEQNDATVQTQGYNGTTINYWESDQGTTAPTAVARMDDTLVLAVRPDDIKPFIDTASGETESLSSNENFSKIADALTMDKLVFGYLDSTQFDSAMLAQDPEYAAIVNDGTLGSSAGYNGWAVYASDNGFHMDSVMLPEDTSTIDTMTPFQPSIAANTPADALLFANANNLAGSGLTDIIAVMLQASFSQSEASMMMPGSTPAAATTTAPQATPTTDEVWAMVEQQVGFNPKTDLIDHLDGQYGMWVQMTGLDTGSPNANAVFVSETSDPTAVAGTMDTITNIITSQSDGSFTTSTRTAGDGEFTVMTFPNAMGEGADVVVEYGVVNGHMVIGLNDGVDAWLADQSAPLSEDPAYTEAMGLLPQENIVSVQYLNVQQLMPVLDMAAMMSQPSASSIQDNDEACGDYETQTAAQDAYDADSSTLWNLDMDFDGTACEDYFGTTTPEASPVVPSQVLNVSSVASVTSIDGDMVRTNSVIVIP